MKRIGTALLFAMFVSGCASLLGFKKVPSLNASLGVSKVETFNQFSILEPGQIYMVKQSITAGRDVAWTPVNTTKNGRITKVEYARELQQQLVPGDRVYISDIRLFKEQLLFISIISEKTYDVVVADGVEKNSQTETRRAKADLTIPLKNRGVPDIKDVEKELSPFLERVQ